MYKIKAKPGYNIIINDIELTVQSGQVNWTYVSKKLFDNSKDVLKVKDLLIIENAENDSSDNSPIEEKELINPQISELKNNAFVRKIDSEKKVENVFIADHSKDDEKKLEDELTVKQSMEEVKIEKEVKTDELKEEAKDVIVEEKIKKDNLKENKVESPKITKNNKNANDKKETNSKIKNNKDLK